MLLSSRHYLDSPGIAVDAGFPPRFRFGPRVEPEVDPPVPAEARVFTPPDRS